MAWWLIEVVESVNPKRIVHRYAYPAETSNLRTITSSDPKLLPVVQIADFTGYVPIDPNTGDSYSYTANIKELQAFLKGESV